MSRKIEIRLGARDAKDAKSLLKALIPMVQEGFDDVTISAECRSQADPQPEQTRVDEALETEMTELVEKTLDECENQAQIELKPPPMPVAVAVTGVKTWRQMVNESGWKVMIEAVLVAAWQEREAAKESLKDFVRDIMQ